MFGKFVLGVNRKACNAGVRGELGLFPVYLDIIVRIVNFADRLRNSTENSLLKAAYVCSIEYDRQGCKTWYTGFKKILNDINMNENEAFNLSKSEILQKCKTEYVKHWRNDITRAEAKLNLYSEFKQYICLENYLIDIKNFKYRQAITKLRISAHQLEVERGRYFRPIVPRDQRICKFCSCNVCDDEQHFLTQCIFHDTERTELYSCINNNCNNFLNLSPKNQTIYMLNMEGNALSKFAKFCYNSFEKRIITSISQ